MSNEVTAVRVALVGKGGSGKSAIAGILARALAQQGERVLAVDSDPLPGLSLSLGLGLVDAPIPDDAAEEKPQGEPGPRFRLRTGLSALDAVDQYAIDAPDGVRFLQFGKLNGQAASLLRSQLAFRQILDELPPKSWSVVGDLPGGTRQPFFGWARYADTVLVVIEPTAKGLLSGRRLARLALGDARPARLAAIVNKVSDPGDTELVRSRTGLDVLASVPLDDAVGDAERRGAAVMDEAPDSAAVAVVTSLAHRLTEGRVGAGIGS